MGTRTVIAILLTVCAVTGAGQGAWAQDQRQDQRVVAYTIVNGREIPKSLTGLVGDAERGRRLYFDLDRTGCSGCHGSPGGPGAQLSQGGSAAPSLAGVAGRLSAGAIRLWIVAPGVRSKAPEKPAYYLAGQRTDPNDPRFGEPRLTAAEVEDLVAYLLRQDAAQ